MNFFKNHFLRYHLFYFHMYFEIYYKNKYIVIHFFISTANQFILTCLDGIPLISVE